MPDFIRKMVTKTLVAAVQVMSDEELCEAISFIEGFHKSGELPDSPVLEKLFSVAPDGIGGSCAVNEALLFEAGKRLKKRIREDK